MPSYFASEEQMEACLFCRRNNIRISPMGIQNDLDPWKITINIGPYKKGEVPHISPYVYDRKQYGLNIIKCVNIIMTNIENQYRALLANLLQSAPTKKDRTGVGTKSLFGRQIEHDMSLGFPMLVGKKMYFNHAISELLWILNGRTDMGYLHENGVHYWDDDYKRSGRKDGKLGPVYGAQWRDFNGYDQLMNLMYGIMVDPMSRRHILSAWRPDKLKNMVLPPCHYAIQVNINGDKMDLMWIQRSADVFLGLPYDIAMYGILLELLCVNTEYKPGKLYRIAKIKNTRRWYIICRRSQK